MMVLLSLVLLMIGGLVLFLYLAVERSADWLSKVMSPRTLIQFQLQSEMIGQSGLTFVGFGALAWWFA